MSKNLTYIRLINTQRWRKLRNDKIKKNPLCEKCGEALATEVHHIIPIETHKDNVDEMKRLAYDENNLQALCHECHTEIHREMNKRKNKLDENKRNNELRSNNFIEKYLK